MKSPHAGNTTKCVAFTVWTDAGHSGPPSATSSTWSRDHSVLMEEVRSSSAICRKKFSTRRSAFPSNGKLFPRNEESLGSAHENRATNPELKFLQKLQNQEEPAIEQEARI